MRLSQPRQLLAALLVSLTFPQIIAAPFSTDSTQIATLQRRATPPPQAGQVTPPDQVDGSPVSNPSPIGAPMKPGRTTNYKVAETLTDWIKSRGVEGWCHIPHEKGGCEGWIQVEFTTYMKNKYKIPAGFGGIREQHVFTQSSQAADLTFPPSLDADGGPPTRGVIVELKVESLSQKGAAFARIVAADKQKFADGVLDKYKDYDKVVVAIAWTENTQEKLGDVGMVSTGGVLLKLPATKDEKGNTIPEMGIRLYEEAE